MKKRTKKDNSDSFRKKAPKVVIDPSLDKYLGQTLFSEKLAKANEMLKNTKLPDIKKG